MTIHPRNSMAAASRLRPWAMLAATPLAALAVAACAPIEEPDSDAALAAGPVISTERSCFFTRDVNGYGEAPDGPRGSNRLYVDTGVNERHVLETFGPCPDLDWSFQIGLDTRVQTSLCTGDTATVIVPRGIGGAPDRCTATVIGRVVEE